MKILQKNRIYLFIGIFIFSFLINHCLYSVEPDLLVTPLTPLSWKGVFTIIVIACTLFALIKEVRPPDIILFISACILAIGGALTPKQFLQGFSSDIIMTIAMLCVIVRTLEVNGILNILIKKMLPSVTKGSKPLLSITLPVSALSAFLNNTAVVLMMTPIVRKWALDNKFSPSKFLIPISYASIVGGLCTLIGSSTNVIVDSLLRKHNPDVGLKFFELSWIGIPCVIAVTIALTLIVWHLLPVREDVTSAVSKQTSEFTGEFIVGEDCPLADTLVNEVSGKYFHGELLIEIERRGRTITAPGPFDVILPGDRLVFAGDINQIAELHTIKGLKSAADPHFKIDETSTHFSEVVVSLTSSLIGKTLQQVNFRIRYGASVLAIYRQGKRVEGNVGEVFLDAGDTLVLLSSELWPGDRFARDFYYIRHSERVTIFNPWRTASIAAILAGMVGIAVMGAPIMIAVMIATLLFFVSGSITIREAQRGILWNVLLLIASSFAIANAAEATGVARLLAEILLSIVGTEPYFLIGGILIATCMFTEMLTNNAAALLIFPIAVQAALLGGYTSPEALKTIGVTVAVGASCGFAMPTGYQTHMIVYGPGGYRFLDFIKVGLIIDVIVLAVATCIIPYVWPLV